MDWTALLTDLESSFEARRRAELAAAGADLAEAEAGGVGLAERLHGAVGRRVHLRTLHGMAIDGLLQAVSGQVLVIDEGEGLQAVVPAERLALVTGLGGPAPSSRSSGPSLASVLRALARQGARVRVVLACGEVVGRVGRVGRDHVDIVMDQAPRAGRGGGARTTVVLSAIDVLRSR